MNNLIRNITKKELISEAAGISTIVREWAKVLKNEVEDQLKEHRESELAKINNKSTKKTEPKEKDFNNDEAYNGPGVYDDQSQLDIDFPEQDPNDPFYWKDESGSGRGSSYDNEDWNNWNYKKGNWRDRDKDPGSGKGKNYYKKGGNNNKGKKFNSFSDYGTSYGGYGGYGGSYTPGPYIPPLDEVVVYGDSFPELYEQFGVDMWVLKNSGRIEYDHYKSGYAESGEYIVYLNVPLSSMSESAFIHEIKHAYDDWNRMRHGGTPIRDTWEVKNIYTKDFEKLILGASTQFHQIGPIVRNFYLGSKLETPAYLENEYDNTMVDYEGVAKKLMNFKASTYLDKRGNANQAIEREFEAIKKMDIPLFKKFNNVVDFLYWTQKYFNKRGNDIFRRIAKMRYVHNKPKPVYTTPAYTGYKGGSGTSSYKKPEPKEDHEIGDWVYDPEKGWGKKEEKKGLADLEKKYGVNSSEFEEGETIDGWKYSKDRGWYFDPDESDLDKYF